MNLLRSLAKVSSMTLLSRIFGFVRETVIARTFGAGIYTDAFFVAFKIPNLLRRLFAEGAFFAGIRAHSGRVQKPPWSRRHATAGGPCRHPIVSCLAGGDPDRGCWRPLP